MNGIVKISLVLFLIFYSQSCIFLERDDMDFTDSSFKHNEKIKNGKAYQNKNLILGNPDWIRYHPDSFLVILDRSFSNQLKIIDLKSDSIQEYIAQGKGPGEMIVPYCIQIFEKDIYVFDLQLSKIIILSPLSLRQFCIKNEFRLSEKNLQIYYPLEYSLMVFQSSLEENTRLTFFNHEGKSVKKIGDLPPLSGEKRVLGANQAFVSWIAASDRNKKFALACAYTDIIEIFDYKGSLIRRIQGPLGIQLSVTNKNIPIGSVVKIDPLILVFNRIDAGDNEFWIGYTGFKIQKGYRQTYLDVASKRFYCFDWKGHPLRKIEADSGFVDFDIDWKNKTLYNLRWSNKSLEIASYPLDNILNDKN